MRTTRTAGPAAAGTAAAGPDPADADPAGPAPVGSVAVRSASAGQADRTSAGRHRASTRVRRFWARQYPSRPGERAAHLVAAQRGPATRERLTLPRSLRPDPGLAWPGSGIHLKAGSQLRPSVL